MYGIGSAFSLVQVKASNILQSYWHRKMARMKLLVVICQNLISVYKGCIKFLQVSLKSSIYLWWKSVDLTDQHQQLFTLWLP